MFSTNTREPPSTVAIKIPSVKDNYAGCSRVEGELPYPTAEASDVEDIPSTTTADHQQNRLHIWTKDHPPGQIIGNPAVAKVPMDYDYKISAIPTGESADHKTYRGKIWSLMYLTARKIDIVFATSLGARYQADPKVSHLTAVKQILSYLKGSKALALWYPIGNELSLQSFTDVDHAGCRLDRKSISDGYQFLGGRLVSWYSRKQNCVSMSTTEEKYMATASCYSQIQWMKTQLMDYGYKMLWTDLL
ncbi:secreted RxLR effector protein 161-like [Lactuca sativa]|uniref:secreted RxLR effector protein 161-like n=1 Tax=Lactuca sativa TaxID=4236 RepID=UPI000CD84F3B|nr:secreted RxLR effector protein 161-like [Lactuca sativa]